MTARSAHMRTTAARQTSAFQTEYGIRHQEYRDPTDCDAASRSGRSEFSWPRRSVEKPVTGYARRSTASGMKSDQNASDFASNAVAQRSTFQNSSLPSYENRAHTRQLHFGEADLGDPPVAGDYRQGTRSTREEGHRMRNNPHFSSVEDNDYAPTNDYNRQAFARRSGALERHDMPTFRPPSPSEADLHTRANQKMPFRADGGDFQAQSQESAQWGHCSQPRRGEAAVRGGYGMGRDERLQGNNATSSNSRYDDEMLPRYAEHISYAGLEQEERAGSRARHVPGVSKEPLYDGYWGDNGASAYPSRQDTEGQWYGDDKADGRQPLHPAKASADYTRPYSGRRSPSKYESAGYTPMSDDRSSSFSRFQPTTQQPWHRSIRDNRDYEATGRWQDTTGSFPGVGNRRDVYDQDFYRRNDRPWSHANAPRRDRSVGRDGPYMRPRDNFSGPPAQPLGGDGIQSYRANGGLNYPRLSETRGDMQELFRDIETIKVNLKNIKPRYEFRRNFYMEHPAVANMSKEASNEERRKRNIYIIQPTDPQYIPNPVLTFEQASFPEAITNRLQHFFSAPTAIQVQGWPIALSGHNMIGIAETGCGKTLAFILPALIHIKAQHPVGPGEGPVALVLAPTRELAEQIGEEAARFAICMDQRVVTIFGQMDGMRNALDDIRQGVHILVACPGKLMDFCRRSYLTLDRVTYFVLDEADRLLDMGYKPQIQAINSLIREDRQILMWSATWPQEVQNLVRTVFPSQSHLYHIRVGSGSKPVATLKQEFVYAPTIYGKEELFFNIMSENATKLTLVFANTKRSVDQLANDLPSRTGKRVFPVKIHGDLPQADRRAALDSFREKRNNCLVATELASRGLDVQNILVVVNYDCPQDIEAYIHRVGRTGRAGRAGTSITIVTPSDIVNSAQFFENIIPCLKENHQIVPTWLEDMAQAANASRGRSHPSRYHRSKPTNNAVGSATDWSAADEWRQWSVAPDSVTGSDPASELPKNSVPLDTHTAASPSPPPSDLPPIRTRSEPDVKQIALANESAGDEKTSEGLIYESIDPSPRSENSTSPAPSSTANPEPEKTFQPRPVAQTTSAENSACRTSRSHSLRPAFDDIKRELGDEPPPPTCSNHSPHLPVKTEEEEDAPEGNVRREQPSAPCEKVSSTLGRVSAERCNSTTSTPRPSTALKQQQEDDDNDDWAASVPQWSPPRP